MYLDDVSVFGETQEELLFNLSLVLQRYQHAGLTENPKKCVFLQDSLPFLGHIVSAEGLATDPEKVRASGPQKRTEKKHDPSWGS